MIAQIAVLTVLLLSVYNGSVMNEHSSSEALQYSSANSSLTSDCVVVVISLSSPNDVLS